MSHGRKPRKIRWPANNRAHESTVHKLRTFDAEESAELVNEARMAWHYLTHGKGTKDHFDTLGNALNATEILCEPIGQQAVDIAISAQLAVVSMQQRYHRTGQFGADAEALEHVPAGLYLFEQLMSFSNPLQLVTAVEQSWQRIREGDVLASAHPQKQQRRIA
jgi:hypothetical protein